MNQLDLTFGTPPYKLARRDSPATSKQAAESVDTPKLERLVLDIVKATGLVGCTQDDALAALPGRPYSSITARFRALLDKGYVVDTLTTRAGRSGKQQRVVVANIKGA